MRHHQTLNRGWLFREGFDPQAVDTAIEGQAVDLPHAAVELPLNYFDETLYQRPFTYQRVLEWNDDWAGQDVLLRFDGAMADAVVWVNDCEAARHTDGYTPFSARLTPHLRRGSNRITVKVDGSENPEIPPFGGRIDYLTYAGIYRDVWLTVTPTTAIDRIRIETPNPLEEGKRVKARVWLRGRPQDGGELEGTILDPQGKVLARATTDISGPEALLVFDRLSARLWTLDDPVLYTLAVELNSPKGTDALATRFGFRSASFTPYGFLLNGEPVKLMGLNRHQSFPYSGYAQGRRSQERDAEILKFELGCNIVRTSHYPQSPWFLDRCDEIGLLVFEEIPGWQHIGGEDWKTRSVENVRAMIRRDCNHPSVVIWGVRINESRDDHDFYTKTNAAARIEDPTRQTGGVRFITESEMLEDVYTMNDFILGDFEKPGSNRPRTALRPQSETTGLARPVPYLVTEYNGHMYPTKASDPEQRQAEHVLRHLDVVDAAYGDPLIAGCIGWCMADYNTHKDFGSGDRICHHGVLTMFRTPKFAAHVYSSQQPPERRIVMEPVTYWSRGERNIGGVLPLVILTNCDAVELRYGDIVKRIAPDRERYPHLPYAPVIIDQRHFSNDELGRWGMAWLGCTITGIIADQTVATRSFAADPVPTRLEALADSSELDAAELEEVRIVLRALDQCGNVLPFLWEAVDISVSGPARLIGPDRVVLSGGTAAFWIRASGKRGKIAIRLRSARFASVSLSVIAT